VSNFVLGIIAFSLGANLTVKSLKAAGSPVLWISILEAGCAWLVVTLVVIAYLLVRHMPIHPAFVLGAAASATAPAATVMVVREYQARGVVTDMLLRVVAIDDAWCLIFSALAITFATALHTGVVHVGVIGIALLEILASITFGVLCGFGLHVMSRLVTNKDELLIVMLGYILLLVGLSVALHLSSLLTCMAAGILVTNVNKNSTLFFSTLREVDPVLFLSFFILVGANLELGMVPHIGVIGMLYIVFRIIGKFLGVTLGSLISHADPKIGKYLAWGLVPQAGVALGVALTAKTLYPVYGVFIFTTITATTVIYELIGPVCAKYGLKKAGEI
jgi:NhaP-type Na+/H+ or K+/H+ antiporter